MANTHKNTNENEKLMKCFNKFYYFHRTKSMGCRCGEHKKSFLKQLFLKGEPKVKIM